MKSLLRRALLGVVLALAAITLIGAPANAADGDAPVVVVTWDWALIIQLLVSAVLPLLVGLVTKEVTNGAIKAWLLATFSLVTSLLVEVGDALAAGTTYDLGRGLILALPTFISAVAVYYGLWKPTGTAQAAQRAFVSGESLRRDRR